MLDTSPLSLTFLVCCLLIALFYFSRLGCGRRWLRDVDVENEIGHGMMAVGMVFMLAPGSIFSPALIFWNMLVFAGATLWWTVRLLTHKPVLALVWKQYERCSPAQSDALHILMHAGMCYMFLLMSSMTFSMTSLAIYLTCLFFVAFTFLGAFYGRECAKDGRSAKKNWLQLGANLAHLCMSGIMCWMLLSMLVMTMSMSPR